MPQPGEGHRFSRSLPDRLASGMCLVLLLHDTHPDYRLIVAANRDEFYDRPTLPAALWPDAPGLVAGRDLRAGGTWLGIDRTGRFAAVTNYRQGQREPAASRSRGHLVSDYLIGRMSPRAHIARIQRDAEQYNGFNVIAGDAEEVVYFSNREGVARVLAPGVYGLSNHLLDTPWPKVTAGKVALGELARETAAPRLMEELFARLSDRTRPADSLLPETGIGPEWERLLSSAFIASADYGTRSSTVVLVNRDGRTTFAERRFGANGAPAGDARFELAPASLPA
jgi:uncharacterized protein with NRDE domain